MRALLVIAMLVPCAALAQGTTYRPGPVWYTPAGQTGGGPLIWPDPVGTASHTFWKNWKLTESRPVAWTSHGTVPVSTVGVSTKQAAGPFSLANYYDAGTALVAPNNWTKCAAFIPTSDIATYSYILAQDDVLTLRSWAIYQEAGVAKVTVFSGSGSSNAQSADLLVANTINFACFAFTYVTDGTSRVDIALNTRVDVGTYTASKGPARPGGTMMIGRRGYDASPAPFAGTVVETLQIDGAALDAAGLASLQAQFWRRADLFTSRVLALGDSITFSGAIATPYPQKLNQTLGAHWLVFNAGVGGDRTDQILSRWRASYRGTGYKWLVALGGINNISQGENAATAWASLKTTLLEAQADGLRPVVVTVLPAAGSLADPAKDARVVELNTLIKTDSPAGTIVVDAYPAFGDVGGLGATYLKASYDRGDHVHLNQAGADALAALVAAAIPH